MISIHYSFISLVFLNLARAGPLPDVSNDVVPQDELERMKVLESITKEILQYMDESVDPCEDFYGYACNNFENIHPIPSDRSGYNVDAMIDDKIEEIAKEFVEAPPEGDPNEAATKVRLIYRQCLDIEKRKEVGFEPVIEVINALGGWHALNESVSEESYDWLGILGRMGQYALTPIIDFGVSSDYEDPEKYVITVSEGDGMSPLSRSQIVSNASIINVYRNFVEAKLKLSGIKSEVAAEVAEDIVNFGAELVKLTVDDEMVMDAKDIFGRMTLGELQSKIPEVDLIRLFETSMERTLDPNQIVNVRSTPYFEKLPELLSQTETKTIINYLFWQIIQTVSSFVDERYKEVNHQLLTVVYGVKTTKPLSEKCLSFAQGSIRRPIEAFFIKNYFDSESKTAAMEMTHNFRKSFRKVIAAKEWLDDETKNNVLEKLDNMIFLMGYPEELASDDYINDKYKDVKIVPGNFFYSVMSLIRALAKESYNRLDEVCQRDEWKISSMTVNAFYSRILNRILIPAGHLQPPYYHRYYPRAINFGAMGMVIGHEMTHGFDKGGRNHDSKGRILESWTNSSASLFDNLSECFVDQYGQYQKYNTSIRGRATADENISDSGGIRLAYNAYLEWLEENRDSDNLVLPGLDLNDKQLFFLAYTHSWCTSTREGAMMNSLQTDSHSPAEFRIRGSLSNFLEFSEAYNCPVGSTMNPEKKCAIW